MPCGIEAVVEDCRQLKEGAVVSDTHKMFCFGLGFTGSALAHALLSQGWQVSGTRRDDSSGSSSVEAGMRVVHFDGTRTAEAVASQVGEATHILAAIPPQKKEGDVVLRYFRNLLVCNSKLRWIGYLSTTGVYGNHDGDWVDEASELNPEWDHQKRRVQAEEQWLDLFWGHQMPVHVFRLAGIYGPGRNLLERVKRGIAQRIDQPGLVFNRIHVEDVVRTLTASIERPNPGAIYNVSDDHPASPAEATDFACELLNIDPPPLVTLEEAGLSEMAHGFYTTNKKVRNRKIKGELGVQLLYPDYQSGLRSLLT